MNHKNKGDTVTDCGIALLIGAETLEKIERSRKKNIEH